MAQRASFVEEALDRSETNRHAAEPERSSEHFGTFGGARRRVGQAMVVLVAALIGMLVPVLVPAAQARSANDTCWAGRLDPNGTVAACTDLVYGEQVRAVVECDGFWSNYRRYGPWSTRDMQRSEIYCDKTGDAALNLWYDVIMNT